MAIFEQGISNSTKSVLGSSTPNKSKLNSLEDKLNSKYVNARVTDIILNNSHPKFNEVGQWGGIGAIIFEPVSPTKVVSFKSSFALPMFNMMRYPLIDEIVTLSVFPGKGASSNASDETYYYLPPVKIWNTPNQNSNPSLPVDKSQFLNNNYSSNGNGEVIQPTNELFQAQLNSPNDPSQEKFTELNNIRSLLPQAGDTIIEGRNGQSIRFSQENGNPITLLRNGQDRNTPPTGFEPTSENVKNDLSSIYLTSEQKIESLSLVNENFISYSTPPITPSQFEKPQIILNSDRIVIEAETDSILLSSQKSIGLLSNESVNIESKDINLHTNNRIRLGSKNATESVLLGDKTYDVLNFIFESLNSICTALETKQIYPGGIPIPDAPTNLTAGTLSQAIKTVKEKVLVNIKSNKVKVE
jgi:hypothetical protein